MVINGQPFVQIGSILPDIAPYNLTSIGLGVTELDDSGRVLWYGDWNDPMSSQSVGLFLDDRLLIQRGVTTVAGVPFQGISGSDQAYSLSRNGRYVVFRGTLSGGGTGFFMVDMDQGTTYCNSTPTSVGLRARLHALGTLSIADNDLTFIANNLPPEGIGLIYFGPGQVQIPFGNGIRCVGGGQLFRRPTQNTTKAGILAHQLDYLADPVAGQVVSGSTWNFQSWFRDTAAGGSGFNFSDGISVTFEP